MDNIVIRNVEATDVEGWRLLWEQYLIFYGASLAPEVTAATWTRICDPQSPLSCRVAEHDGELLGFAIAHTHLVTFALEPTCYLEDLFVAPGSRGKGIARALIQDLLDLADVHRWSSVYWHTRDTNTAARRVYDAYARADDHVRYRITF